MYEISSLKDELEKEPTSKYVRKNIRTDQKVSNPLKAMFYIVIGDFRSPGRSHVE